jgi:hypothetical protein
MKRIISIFLTLLLLASSSGIAYARHYCGEYEMLSKITLGEKHLSCGMAMVPPGCEDEGDMDHDCCANDYTQVETDDTFAKASFEIDFNKIQLVLPVSFLVAPVGDNYPVKQHFFYDYNPPPLEQDFTILFETFLI